ncbi:MAG: HD domain-containing phosphohydrolase, partial [Bdellovibrionota bacterium]
TRSRDILQQISSLPDEIALIAFNHHENRCGTGYPQRLIGEAIHPVARLISIANKFCNLMFPVRDGTTPMGLNEALSRMMTTHADELDPTMLRRLLSLFPESERKTG